MIQKIFFTLIALLFSAQVFAGGSKLPSGGGSYGGGGYGGGHSGGGWGQVVCKSYDDGWEEHGWHSSCGECLSRHGGCYERCYKISYRCTAKGTSSDGSQQTFQAIGRDRSYTADEALSRCQSSGANNCTISQYSDCSEDQDVVSSKRCNR